VILEKIFYTDSFGRTIYINPKIGNEYIQKIKDFNKEETIFDFQTKQKISYDDLVKKYFKNDEVYMVSKLNNKIVIQNQTITNIFSLKNEYDCSRLVISTLNKSESSFILENVLRQFSNSSLFNTTSVDVLPLKS